MNFGRRLEKIETSLTPRQAVLFWLQERRDVGAAKYWEKALSDPMNARTRVAKTVTDALRENIRKGLIGKRMERAVREAVIHGDMLMVLVGVLEENVRSECRLNTLRVKLLLDRLRRMMLESKPNAQLQAENWDEWREQLVARRSKMQLLREAVESISKMHYDGQALLFAEHENKLNQTIDMLEEVVGIYNIFQNGRTELKRINTDAVADADALEAIVEYFEVTAKALSMSQLGDATEARKLAVTYLSRVYGKVKDANPTLSLRDYLTT